MRTRKSRKFIKHPKILKYEYVTWKSLEILFKWDTSQNNSATLLIMCYKFVFFESLHWICFTFVYFIFNAQKVELVVKKLIHMDLDFTDLKTNIFCNFRVLAMSQKRKLGNYETKIILIKNTKIWDYTFKNSRNALQITPMSKWFSHIPNQLPCIYPL